MTGVPIVGSDKRVLGRAMEIVRDAGAERLARCLVNIPAKQVAALIAMNPWGRGQVSSKGLWTQGCLSKHAEGQTTGRSGRTTKSSSHWVRPWCSRCPRGLLG